MQLQEIAEALQESSRNLQEERRQIVQKMDDLSHELADLRKENQQAIDTLRRDFERMFVSHAEYDPKHNFLVDKIKEHDTLFSQGQVAREESAKYHALVTQNTKDIAEIQDQRAGWAGRLLPWIGLLISIATFLVVYGPHIQIR